MTGLEEIISRSLSRSVAAMTGEVGRSVCLTRLRLTSGISSSSLDSIVGGAGRLLPGIRRLLLPMTVGLGGTYDALPGNYSLGKVIVG